jgi:membrane-associated protease RseP (regulator of RpoE activity)
VNRRPPVLLNLALFLATILTTTATGAIEAHRGREGDWLSLIMPISDGLSYSVPLMLILVCHELGHYLVSRLYGVEASLPYFIPVPFGLGTLGAVIGMREVTGDRKKLIDIGAAGPLAGLAVAVPVILYGLAHSPVGPLQPGGGQEGNSIAYALLKHASKGAWLPGGGRDVFLNPTAWAGWAGLLLTMINLLPVGQLDGGHIATAFFGNGYGRFAVRLHRAMPLVAIAVCVWAFHIAHREATAMGAAWDPRRGLAVGLAATLPWLVWSLMVSVVRRLSGGINHPPVDDLPLPRSRRALFWIMVAVFVGIFMPVPFRPTYEPPKADATAQAMAQDR